MRKHLAALSAALCLVFLASTVSAADNEAPEGFTALFNGKDLTGWHGMKHRDPYELAAMSEEARAKILATETADMREHWTVEHGELINDGHGAYLTTDRELGDVEFLIDYKTVAKADSGIYLRATPQVQIWDSTKAAGKWDIGADKGSGGLWNNAARSPGRHPAVRADRPFGEWNRFRIIQIGSRTTVFLNDKLVVDNAIMENYWDRKKPSHQKRPLPQRGPIQLQTHGGEIRWRNVFVREIPPREANAYLQGFRDRGFRTVFDGLTFSGWKEPGTADGVVENYMIRDGALMCRPGRGTTLHTVEEYGDFVVRVEFNLPSRGNNGLAIRYPGSNDAAYAGMCEIQVLAADYTGIEPWQAHGSAYAMVAAHGGYLRPNGQWNFQEVTVVGRRVRVELNGNVILDCDLGELKDGDFGYGREKQAGLARTTGHFGFAGHGDPVKFRNVRIKRLD